ncbi:hypothetical protein [Actinomadura madurae]|uniref:hypothetical protein n=1 Tax=Actinomadura madurae TaxID=1993 RepID=UPI0020D254D8|nr:hypothetical protein [Actinomadura madurae]MCP9955429.1 hypothetical protein [Actinomadura madurae]MCQ0003783.1 hypothetical protein [Actinomadura madurae]
MADRVTICECFARDGLQHEETFLSTKEKLAVIEAIAGSGFQRIEATSYSHPEHVPAFRDAGRVLAGLRRRPGSPTRRRVPTRERWSAHSRTPTPGSGRTS